jgi:hypothetical protein
VLQLTAFGARDRAFFEVILCRAPWRQLKRRPLGQKCHHAHEPTIVFSPLQAGGAQSTFSNAISFNAFARSRTWQRNHEKRNRTWRAATPSSVISHIATAQARHSNAITGQAFEARRAWRRQGENAIEGSLRKRRHTLASGTALRLAMANRPNKRLQLTPLRGRKIGAFLKGRFSWTILPI